jgi:predicted nucleic acid-binding protein
LQRNQPPARVRAWIASPLAWLEVWAVKHPLDPTLEELDAGEQQALTLAQELGAQLLILDDKDARKVALRRRFTVIGTLGVLDEAAKLGLVNIRVVFSQRQQTSFRADADLLN